MSANASTSENTLNSGANHIKFIVLLVSSCLSCLCSLFLLFNFLSNSRLRHSIQNHVIILLLIISFFFVCCVLPLTEDYLNLNRVRFTNNLIYCSTWNFLQYSVNIVNLFLMAFASIERHIIIFHQNLLQGTYKRLFGHYLPLVICMIYPTIFYFTVIFLYPCEQYYDYTQLLCTWPCYFYNLNLANYDLFANNWSPLFVIPIFSFLLFMRVLCQKRRMQQQAFKWKRDRKLTIQLLSIALLYLCLWLPLQTLQMINNFWLPDFAIQLQIDYIFLFPYYIHILYPFIILVLQKKLRSRISNLFRIQIWVTLGPSLRTNTNTVHPIMIMHNTQNHPPYRGNSETAI